MAEDMNQEPGWLPPPESEPVSGSGTAPGSSQSSSAAAQPAAPVGRGSCEVKQGECMESIAYEQGFFWKTLWTDSHNAELKEKRGNPNVLLPGDQVFIPDKRVGRCCGATEQKHRFRRKGVPSRIHLVLERNEQPLANVPYVLDIDGRIFESTTNDKGEVQHPIPPNAKQGKLIVGSAPDTEVFELVLGYLDPIDDLRGVQARLNNLGFDCGLPDGQLSEQTVRALKSFQEAAGLPANGGLDPQTNEALQEEHLN